MFDGKSLLITGGTGSFGAAVVDRLITTDIAEIRVLSRDELKQTEMRAKYSDTRLKFHLGDVRDKPSINQVFKDLDYVFHAAALKQVPSCEFFPIEAVKTNVLGTENVLNCAIEQGVSRVVCLSTDKAVYPVNAMGMTKGLMEKVMVAKARSTKAGNTVLCGTRYGNVMASRGSVIPLFVEQILNDHALTVTDPLMTRFMMSLDEAVDLVLYAFSEGSGGDLFVQKSPAASLDTLVKALKIVFDAPSHPVEIIGTRHGEKVYEVLLNREEFAAATDEGSFYRVPMDDRELNYSSYIDTGATDISSSIDYDSSSTRQLSVDEMVASLRALPYIKALLNPPLER